MAKLFFFVLVLCILVVSCLAVPFSLESWFGEAARRWRPGGGGCADRGAGRAACARVNGSTLLAPHPHDCRLFYYCSNNGSALACRRCPPRLHFNPAVQVCDWPQSANCTVRPRPRPSTTTAQPSTAQANATASWSTSTESPVANVTSPVPSNSTNVDPPASNSTDVDPPSSNSTFY